MATAVAALVAAAENIKKVADAISAVENALKVFDRSVVLEIDNTCNVPLTLQGTNHNHGDFKSHPPQTIAPHSSVLFSSASSGLATGTEGQVRYHLDGADTLFHIGWVNPFIGTSDADSRIDGIDAGFYVNHDISGGGNTAHMRYLVGELAEMGPKQPDWHTCLKCKSMFFAPHVADSHCAAGGLHETSGSNFSLPHDVPGPNRQPEWRTCLKCKTMFFNGDPSQKGVCAAPSPSSHSGVGFPFHLSLGGPQDNPHQSDWRQCPKCLQLFFGGQIGDSRCPAGGTHSNHPNNYFLPFNRADDATHQTGWQTCGKCKSMFFVPQGSDSECPAGDRHAGAGFVFQLPHDNPGPGRQPGWQTCGKCKTMFFNGGDFKGVCAEPSASSHEAAGSIFHLPHDVPGAGQDEWKFCVKCFGLVFEPQLADSTCPAGDRHVAAGFNFRLEHS
jgi:hypothetical protein